MVNLVPKEDGGAVTDDSVRWKMSIKEAHLCDIGDFLGQSFLPMDFMDLLLSPMLKGLPSRDSEGGMPIVK